MRLMSTDAAPQKRGAEPDMSRPNALVVATKASMRINELNGCKAIGRRNR